MKTQKIKIEHGIKIPKRKGGGRGPSPLTVAAGKMRVGDSVLARSPSIVTTWNTVYKPKRFSSRIIDKKCRVWRVK